MVVEADDLVPVGEQFFDEIAGDEAGGSCDESLHEKFDPFP
jgi:hypothetical protein